MSIHIPLSEAKKMLVEYDKPYFFSVEFFQRTNGNINEMVCRKGVTKNLAGRGLIFDPKEYDLLPVWESTRTKEYRMINLNGLIEFKLDGQRYIVTPDF